MVADRMQPDEVRARTSGEMPPEFLHSYHIGAERPAFRYRQHDDTDLVAAERILAPDVAAIDQPFHGPLRQVISALFPFVSDPEQSFISGEFTERGGHRLSTNKINVSEG